MSTNMSPGQLATDLIVRLLEALRHSVPMHKGYDQPLGPRERLAAGQLARHLAFVRLCTSAEDSLRVLASRTQAAQAEPCRVGNELTVERLRSEQKALAEDIRRLGTDFKALARASLEAHEKANADAAALTRQLTALEAELGRRPKKKAAKRRAKP